MPERPGAFQPLPAPTPDAWSGEEMDSWAGVPGGGRDEPGGMCGFA